MEEHIFPDEDNDIIHRRPVTSRLWYAALVPLFGIFTEIYADSLAHGLLIWIMAVIMSPAACLLDRRYIRKMGADTGSLKKIYALLPPLYIFKRTKLTGDSPVCGLVWCMMFVFALISNNFTKGLTMKEITMTRLISDSYWSRIEETADFYCGKTVGETLEELSGGTLTWSASRAKGCLKVECAGENGFSADFSIDFDGYVMGDRHFESLTFDGKTLDGAEAAELIKEKFAEKEDDSAAETDGENSSAADESAAA